MKRFISILLAMCICLSIGVCGITVSAETATEPTISTGADRVTDSTITYYFDGYAFGVSDSTSIEENKSNLTIDKFTDVEKTTRGKSSAKWGLFGMSGGDAFKALVRAQSVQWQPLVPETTAVFNPDSEETIYSIAFELDVKSAGSYIPKLNYYGNENSPKVEIYVLPKSKNAEAWTDYDEFVKKLSTSDRLCELDLYKATADWYDSENLPAVDMEEGSNLFIMVLNGMNDEANLGGGSLSWHRTEYLRPRYLSLTPVNKTLEYDFSLSAFEYEKMPRLAANKISWKGVRVNSGADTPIKDVIGTSEFQGIQNTDLLKWNAQIDAEVLEETDSETGVTTAKYATLESDYSVVRFVDSYYVMKEQNDDTYWGIECVPVSTINTKNRAWGDGRFYADYAAGSFSTESETKGSSQRAMTVFRIYVKSAGEYTLSTSIKSGNPYVENGCVSDVYIMKAPEETLAVSQIDGYISNGSFKFLGKHDGTQGKNEDYTAIMENKFTAEQGGEYILLFDTAKNMTTANTAKTLSLSGVKLNPVITPDTEKEKIENEDGNTISATDTAETSVTVQQGKAVLGGDTEPTFTEVEVNSDGYATVTATETDETGNKFLYWAKGLKTGIGKKVFVPDNDNELSCTFKPETGVNYIIAVYAPASGSTGETRYCNANGQLLTDADENTVPTMPGYTFAEWVDCGNGMKVADYTENETTYTVTVKHQDGEAEAVEKETLSGKKYGDSVTVTAPSRFGGSGYNVFNYWEKEGKIVSFNKSYTFNVWETCDVTAVYKPYAPVATTLKKIIIDDMGGNNLMAEFIGFGDVAEKGIVFGTNATLTDNEGKATMTSNKTQFTVNNDIDGTPAARGYVIDKAGNVYYGN